jgi:pilus assembly protein Flp/PilA
MTNLVKRFAADESGATAIEYGLIAAGISVAIITVVNTTRSARSSSRPSPPSPRSSPPPASNAAGKLELEKTPATEPGFSILEAQVHGVAFGHRPHGLGAVC